LVISSTNFTYNTKDVAYYDNITSNDATIGTSLTTIATIAGKDIKVKIASYALSGHNHDSTYVKLDAGTNEQSIKSSIASLSKGVINLWRSSGDHYTFLGFSNGTTETYLGGIGFKAQADREIYHKTLTSSNANAYYRILTENHLNYTSSGTNYKVQADSSNNLYVSVPWSNTDTLVNQSRTTTGNWRGIVLGYNSSATVNTGIDGTTTNVVYTTNNLTV
jgi:hypothetical protein